MGGHFSKEDISQVRHKEAIDLLKKNIEKGSIDFLKQCFYEFLEEHTEMDSNGYVMYNDIISHFYTYIHNKKLEIAISNLNNLIFRVVKETLENHYDKIIVRPEGISSNIIQGHTYRLANYNYSYIHGLKLTKSVYTA